MTTTTALILAALTGYLCGALPFGYWAGKLKGIDIRQHGSGNIGATNVIRVLGKPIGIPVFLLDMLKGWLKSCHINEIYKDSTGVYPYRELFRLLREINYDRYTLVEIGRTPVDAASGEDMLRYYKALWTELTRG